MSTLQLLLLLVQTVITAGLAWSCFCRLVRTDAETIREIRLAIWLEGIAAGFVCGAPVIPLLVPDFLGHGGVRWQPGGTPTWAYVLLAGAATLMQWVTAKFWHRAPPADFQKGGCP